MAAGQSTRPDTKDRFRRLRKIESLDPATDYREITALFYQDFQAIMVLQAVTGNLMTFAVPRMSRILASTGQFEHHTGKRVVDTTLLVSAVMEHGLEPGTGREAAKRVNAMHRAYEIHPDDFVAVGCDVPLMSLAIADRFGWRPVSDAEREALRIHYSKEARAFGSHRPLPPTLPEMYEYWNAYLDEQIAYEPQNKRLAEAFLAYLPSLAPKPLRRLVAPLLLSLVDPRILRGCGLAVPSALRRRAAEALFARLGKTGPGPDAGEGEKNVLEKRADEIYPHGWSVNTLGTHLSAPGPNSPGPNPPGPNPPGPNPPGPNPHSANPHAAAGAHAGDDVVSQAGAE